MGYNADNPGIPGRLYAFFSMLCAGLIYLPVFFIITLLLAMGMAHVSAEWIQLSLYTIVIVTVILATVSTFLKKHSPMIQVVMHLILVMCPMAVYALEEPLVRFVDDHHINILRHDQQEPKK